MSDTSAKCEEILRSILLRSNERLARGDRGWAIAFGPDWGGPGLTIYDADHGHTHIGGDLPGDTFEVLIDEMYAQLLSGRGLSWED